MRQFALLMVALSTSVHNFAWAGDNQNTIHAALAAPHPHMLVRPGVDLLIPQIVDGAGWKTSIFLTNMDSRTINFAVLLSDDRGKPLSLPVAGMGSVAAVYGTLSPNASATIETEGTAATLAQGYAMVFTLDKSFTDPTANLTTDRLAGMAVFRQRVPVRPDSEAVVPFSSPVETSMVVPFDNRSGYVTALALLSLDTKFTTTVDVVIRDQAGAVIKRDSVVLDPMGKATFALPDRFPDTAGRSGRLDISTTGLSLGALGLRFNPSGSFTSFHSLSMGQLR